MIFRWASKKSSQERRLELVRQIRQIENALESIRTTTTSNSVSTETAGPNWEEVGMPVTQPVSR